MKLGGYQIVDFKRTALSTSAETAPVVPGVYAAIEGTQKRLVASGLLIDDAELPDASIMPTVVSGDYVFTVYGYIITVTDDDEVTVVESTLPAAGYTAGDGIDITDGEISVKSE